jgi:hypothetical protein
MYNNTNFRLHGIPWVIIMGRSRKDPYFPMEEISGGEKKLFLIIVNVLGHPKRDMVNFLFPPWGWYGCFLG